MKRNAIVTKKASPHPMAMNLNRVLSIRILLEYSCDKVRSSEVMSNITAIAASHKLRSVSVRGIIKLMTTLRYLRT
jgi:hypothetical protein